MKVVIITFGTRGNVAPLIGLGARLRAAGHDVAVAAQALFADEIRAAGLEFRPIPGDIRSRLESGNGQAWQRSGGMRAMRAKIDVAVAAQPEVAEGVITAAEGADVLLLQYLVLVHGYLVGQAMGIPCVSLEFFPTLATREFLPAFYGAHSFGHWANRAVPQVTSRFKTPLDPGVRDFQRRLGLPVTGLPAVNRALAQDRRLPVYHGFSPAIVPRPPDWRPGAEVAGYWWPERPPDWTPPAGLVDFLAAGPPPVYIGFGSMAGGDGGPLSGIVSEAVRRAGVRAVVGAGWAGLSSHGDDVFVAGEVPHDWLFPQMAAVVHHAGGGTTGAALRAGVPAVTAPVLSDQAFWAARLMRIGVSPGSRPLRRVTADWLATMIRQATSEPAYRSRAQAVAEQVGAEDGAGYVLKALERDLYPRPAGR